MSKLREEILEKVKELYKQEHEEKNIVFVKGNLEYHLQVEYMMKTKWFI